MKSVWPRMDTVWWLGATGPPFPYTIHLLTSTAWQSGLWAHQIQVWAHVEDNNDTSKDIRQSMRMTTKFRMKHCAPIFLIKYFASAKSAKSLQSCLTLCDPIDGSPPGSTVPGILQARTLEWVAISFSNAWKWKVKTKSLSRVRLLVTPWTAAYQAPPPMGFSRQEYWTGVPLPCMVISKSQH